MTNVFETNPDLLRYAMEYEEQENTEQNTQSLPGLTEFIEVTPDDGAKARLKSYSIIDAYHRWFSPKDMKDSGGGNYLTNCFNNSGHSNGDSNPSMCLKTGDNIYTCYGCGISGDMLDLTANHAGISAGGDKVPDNRVHEAVKSGCIDLFADMQDGWVLRNNNWQYDPVDMTGMFLVDFEPLTDFNELEPLTPSTSIGSANIYTSDLQWRDWVPVNTPLRSYMEITSQDSSPEEFHFFNFITLIGLIMGREVRAREETDVYGNLFSCLIAGTGSGKSRTLIHVYKLLERSSKMWFDYDDPNTRGIDRISGIGSGESLVDNLGHSVLVPVVNPVVQVQGTNAQPPTTTKRKEINPSPRKLIIWSEFSNLIAKTKVTGSTMFDKVLEMFDMHSNKMSAITRSYTSHAHNFFGSAISTTQLEVIRNLVDVSDQESGFLNRWIFVVGTEKPYVAYPDPINIDPVFSQIDRLYTWMEFIAKSKHGLLYKSVEAKKEGERFLTDIVNQRMKDPENNNMFGRADLIFKKLTLLMSANMMEQEISLEAIHQAERVWTFYEHSTLTVIEKLNKDRGNEVIEYIESYVASRERKMTDGVPGARPTELRKMVSKKFGLDTNNANKMIKLAEQDGLVKLVKASTASSGRPKTRYMPGD